LVKQLTIVKEDVNLTVPDDLIKSNMWMLEWKGLEKVIVNCPSGNVGNLK